MMFNPGKSALNDNGYAHIQIYLAFHRSFIYSPAK